MAEGTKISWADLEARDGISVHEPVAGVANGDAVVEVEPEIGMFCPRLDVVGVKVSPSIVAAMDARELVSRLHVERPALRLRTVPILLALAMTSVDVRVTGRPARRSLPRDGADLRPGLRRVSLPDPVARPRLRGRAHFGATLGGHCSAFLDQGMSL